MLAHSGFATRKRINDAAYTIIRIYNFRIIYTRYYLSIYEVYQYM